MPWPEGQPTVQACLQQAQALGVARLDAALLLGEALKQTRAWLLAHGEYVLTPEQVSLFRGWLQQRAQGVPLAYCLGRREFHGLMLKVTPDVLDPRPDTETLVDWALEVWPKDRLDLLDSLGSLSQPDPSAPLGRLDRSDRSHRLAPRPASASQPPRVLDLGTGSGAIALALKAAHPHAQVHACDASVAALSVAQANADALGLPLALHAGHWWSAVSGLQFDLAVANPPYIREDDPHLAGLIHEPRTALVAAQEGLADLRAIIEDAPAHLVPGAWLLLEHGHDQATAVAQALAGAGFADIGHRCDLAGHTRCTGGRLPG